LPKNEYKIKQDQNDEVKNDEVKLREEKDAFMPGSGVVSFAVCLREYLLCGHYGK